MVSLKTGHIKKNHSFPEIKTKLYDLAYQGKNIPKWDCYHGQFVQ